MVLILAGTVAVRWDEWVAMRSIQVTDDAYVRAETARISTRVAGEILKVGVNDFQRVRAGELLVQVDPADYQALVDQSTAAVAAAKAGLDNLANEIELQYATIAQSKAQRQSVMALEVEAEQEQERQQTLSTTSSGTRQRLEQAVAALAKAHADVRSNAALIAAQEHQLDVLAGLQRQRRADVAAAEGALAAARLRLGYTKITAPFDGVVSERQVQTGDYVNIGTNLISVVPLPNVYVIANYKETQLRRVREGQAVEVSVDTFRNQPLRGRVQRISPASGSQFALLPPDNATGNFTKVVQRVAVRIVLEDGQPLVQQLLPGMSAVTRIHVMEDAERAVSNAR
ncbi:HlyD family secretion protein [Bradyrhizobium sp. WYCCWR 13023]|uniref:HlyD family secretion protein n=1 Tax=Bradyrhizobium zhengyangense TaxID=2911009 RepID=A0A9X1U6W8_9BRAD|nr:MULTISPECIES: HlyD family secretion protein [Bradyrhizobium]MCG2626281.1 HlyD family secretion protein [Bradyrhizobium zhengyangense]MCG2644707.1 HlyD family secretion protein [Bradyrhizobium zhengyangense]MCG2668289.1 HlyD family secretion protein [Bradyrhizobium zhengyangense]